MTILLGLYSVGAFGVFAGGVTECMTLCLHSVGAFGGGVKRRASSAAVVKGELEQE